MSGAIFLRDGESRLIAMQELAYDSEDVLQRLLADYPDLLAGDQLTLAEPRRWLLIAREAGIPGELGAGARWSVDHLFLDQDGIPTLVEVKRSSDTRIRREVVGQMLDYAANALLHWPLAEIQLQLANRCARQGLDPVEEVGGLIGSDDIESFWRDVERNLAERRMRLVFVADDIPVELKRVVEFLNDQMTRTQVVAIEVRQYVHQERQEQILVPRVIGQTVKSQEVKRSTGVLGDPRDVVVVAASSAYKDYLELSAYICQPHRPFRPVERMAFYADGQIQPEVPQILHVVDEIEFSRAAAADVRRAGEPFADALATVIEAALDKGIRSGGDQKVFLLSSATDSATVHLKQPIVNDTKDRSGKGTAWTQSQRYATLARLQKARSTSDLVDV